MTFFLCRRKTIARIYMHDASIRYHPTAGAYFHIFTGAFIVFARLENSRHCSSFHLSGAPLNRFDIPLR